MIRRPPRSTLDRSSAASDVYKRQVETVGGINLRTEGYIDPAVGEAKIKLLIEEGVTTVSYTHLRAHETVLDLVCRLLLEKKKPTLNKVM